VSLRRIAAGLNAAEIPTPRGHGEWSAVQVQRVIGRATPALRKEPGHTERRRGSARKAA
jgi:hypothetical protein